MKYWLGEIKERKHTLHTQKIRKIKRKVNTKRASDTRKKLGSTDKGSNC